MAKLILSVAVLCVLVGSVHMQINNQLPNGQINTPNMQLPLNAQNLLSNAQGNGLLDTIRQIPARGIQMLTSTLANVRNMFGGLGRNNMMNQMPSLYNSLPQQQQPQASLSLPSLPGMNFLTDPLNQALSGLPNTNGLSSTLNGLTTNLNGLTSSLTNGLNGVIPNRVSTV